MNRFFYVFIFLLIFPIYAEAAVVINEIAWMGNSNSANEEWLELYNSGAEDVSISGWALEAQDGSPKITLSGTIKQNGYFLLERTSDDSIPNVTADLIYTGAMSNSGEILVLKNSSGIEQDRADGSNGWESVGGDNTTKETAQRSGGGWITATATPKNVNAVLQNEVVVAPNQTGSSISSVASLPSQADNIKANAGGNVVAQVGQSIFFDASKSEGASDSFSWNMGNGEVKEGKNFLYSYSFPGKYLVTLFAKNGLNENKDQIDVTIYPAGVYISEFFIGGENDGWIEFHNDSENFVSLSDWKIGNEEDIFIIPKGTLISSNGYLIFAEKTLGVDFIKDSGKLDLIYPNGQAADKVEYQNKNPNFSASRKNKDEFVWTEYKTPGFENITTSQSGNDTSEQIGQVKTNIGVSKSLIHIGQASFVKVNGERSFLITPAYAQVTEEKITSPAVKNNANLNASASSLFSGNFIYLAVSAVLLLGFLFYKKVKT